MKFFLLPLFILAITSCVSTGYNSNPWQNTAGPAEAAPGDLSAPQSPVWPPAGTGQAESHSGIVIDSTTYPGSDIQPSHQQKANSGLQTGTRPVLPVVKIALLVPLSGEHAALGQGMLHAAQLALFDVGHDSFEIMPRDTKGTPDGARGAAQSAADAGAQLILGPLFAPEVRAAAPVAARYNLNMIAFSTDWTLAGGNTFVMGFLPFGQVERVVAYATAQGFGRIGILAPRNEYGNAVVGAYNATAPRVGAQTVETLRFDPGTAGMSDLVRKFTRYDNRNPGGNPAQTAGTIAPNMKPFDAVFLPVGGSEAVALSDLLSYFDLGPEVVKRLGTGLWDERALASERSLKNAWFAASSPDLRRDFETKFLDTYGYRAPRLTTLAYDATALAAVLARSGYASAGRPAFDRAAISNPNGFAGLDGIFRFRPDGLVERGLAILELKDGQIQVVDPAPRTFQKAGY